MICGHKWQMAAWDQGVERLRSAVKGMSQKIRSTGNPGSFCVESNGPIPSWWLWWGHSDSATIKVPNNDLEPSRRINTKHIFFPVYITHFRRTSRLKTWKLLEMFKKISFSHMIYELAYSGKLQYFDWDKTVIWSILQRGLQVGRALRKSAGWEGCFPDVSPEGWNGNGRFYSWK